MNIACPYSLFGQVQEMEPFTRLGFASDILTGQPSSYSSITYGDQAPPVNPLSQIAGLLLQAQIHSDHSDVQ